MSLQQGIQEKQIGLGLVSSHNVSFLEVARRYARFIARENGVVSTDDVREYCDRMNHYPSKPNGYGAIFKGKEWEFVRTIPSRITSNHGRRIVLWRLK